MKKTFEKIFTKITILSIAVIVSLAVLAGCGAKAEEKVDI